MNEARVAEISPELALTIKACEKSRESLTGQKWLKAAKAAAERGWVTIESMSEEESNQPPEGLHIYNEGGKRREGLCVSPTGTGREMAQTHHGVAKQ